MQKYNVMRCIQQIFTSRIITTITNVSIEIASMKKSLKFRDEIKTYLERKCSQFNKTMKNEFNNLRTYHRSV